MDFSQFFTPASRLPDGCGVAMYGPEHLGWLTVQAVVGVLACLRFAKHDAARQRHLLKVLAVWIIGQEILKDVIFIIVKGFTIGHLPLHLCGISIFICAAAAFSDSKLAQQLLYAIVAPGALSALLFPDWLFYPILNFASIHSFSIHFELVLFAALSIVGHRFRPDVRYLPKCFLFLLIIATPIYFLNKLWNTNFLFINTPSPGSPLVAMEKVFGNPGYILALAALFWIVWGVIYLPWILTKRHIRRNCV